MFVSVACKCDLFANDSFRVCACDQESRYDQISEEYKDSKVEIMRNGHYVSRVSDFIIYSVEAENIDKIVSLYGPCKLLKGLFISLLTFCSHQDWRDCGRPDILQGPRDQGL